MSTWLLRCQWNDMKESAHSWLNESTNQWVNEAMNQRRNEAMKQWADEPVNQWIINQWTNGSVNQWINESMKQWISESTIESMNQWFGHQQAHRSTWALFFALAWMTCAPISVCWVGLLFSKLWCPMKAAGEVSLQTGTVCMKRWWDVGMLLGANFSHWVHLSVSTVVYASVSPILYNPILLFRLNFVISCHAQLATLACAKMRAVWRGKSSEKPWHKKWINENESLKQWTNE